MEEIHAYIDGEAKVTKTVSTPRQTVIRVQTQCEQKEKKKNISELHGKEKRRVSWIVNKR